MQVRTEEVFRVQLVRRTRVVEHAPGRVIHLPQREHLLVGVLPGAKSRLHRKVQPTVLLLDHHADAARAADLTGQRTRVGVGV